MGNGLKEKVAALALEENEGDQNNINEVFNNLVVDEKLSRKPQLTPPNQQYCS